MRVLTSAQRDQFQNEGYVVVDGVLDPMQDFSPVMAECEQILDGIAARLFREGRITSRHDGLPFAERLIRICGESGENFAQAFDISLPQAGVRHDTPMYTGPAAFRLLTAPRLLDLVEDIIGPEIYSNPVQHIRIKLPQRAVAKSGPYTNLISYTPWHQDNGVILPEADESRILTVWFSLTESTVANGCMQVFPRSHRSDLVTHCPMREGLAIAAPLLPAMTPTLLPMHPGSVLLMTSRTIHSSLENTTEDEVRMSFDIRYQPTGQPTGRPAFPGFVARSSSDPQSVLSDPAAWEASWLNARAALAEQNNPTFNRWKAGVGACA